MKTKQIHLSKLPKNKFVFILVMALASIVVSLLVGALLMATGLLDSGETVQDPPTATLKWILAFCMIVIAPVLESLILAGIIEILRRLFRNDVFIIIFSSLIWAVAHSLMFLPWGIVIFFSFVIFSYSYLHWRKTSFWTSLFIIVAIHMLQNLVASSFLLFV